MSGIQPLQPSSSLGQNYAQMNKMLRQLDREQQTKAFNGPNGEPAVITGKLPSGEYGIYLSDGTVTTTITASSFKQNDGSHDRLFMGNEGP